MGVVEEVTYSPPDEERSGTTMNGVKFKAGVPVNLDSIKHSIVEDVREPVETADGRVLYRTVQKRVPMSEILRTNPHFIVKGHARAIAVAPGKRPAETAEEYVAEAKGKLSVFKNANDVRNWWADEQERRREFGVSNTELEDELALAVTQRIAVLSLPSAREQPHSAGAMTPPGQGQQAQQHHQRK